MKKALYELPSKEEINDLFKFFAKKVESIEELNRHFDTLIEKIEYIKENKVE